MNIPCEELINKIKSNHVQHELDFASRIINVSGVYAVRDSSLVKGKTILLVDDIVTSGSTSKECCKVLFENGAKEVYCSTIAFVCPLKKQNFISP